MQITVSEGDKEVTIIVKDKYKNIKAAMGMHEALVASVQEPLSATLERAATDTVPGWAWQYLPIK